MNKTTEEQIKSLAGGLMRGYPFADRKALENHLAFAANYAKQTYDPTRGLSLDAYTELCLCNDRSHLERALIAEANKRRITDSTDRTVGAEGGETLGELLCDHRNSARRHYQIIQLREYLAGYKGTAWGVLVAVLAGYSRSEIARHFGVPRTSFDRLYGPAIAGLKEAIL